MNVMMASPTKLAIQPEELSRRISEIDLTNLRRRADTVTGNPPRYTQAELLGLRTENNGVHAPLPEFLEGIKTPNAPPPPPPTPASGGQGSPASGDSGSIQPVAEPKKKKNKRSSGKNKKPAPTGFEGEFIRG